MQLRSISLAAYAGSGHDVQTIDLDEGEGDVSIKQGVPSKIDHLLAAFAQKSFHLMPATRERSRLAMTLIHKLRGGVEAAGFRPYGSLPLRDDEPRSAYSTNAFAFSLASLIRTASLASLSRPSSRDDLRQHRLHPAVARASNAFVR